MPEALRVGVVVSTFNGSITEGLRRGAIDELQRLGVTEPTVVEVPGALELPVVARALADAGHDCVVALGAVIEGETDHYHHVATQTMAGLMQVSVASGRPVGIGLLTVRDVAHAVERSRPGAGNKGAEAARAAVEAAGVIASLRAAALAPPGPDG
jgi:6,7-dimethyl-8-ribityllumazine synthase